MFPVLCVYRFLHLNIHRGSNILPLGFFIKTHAFYPDKLTKMLKTLSSHNEKESEKSSKGFLGLNSSWGRTFLYRVWMFSSSLCGWNSPVNAWPRQWLGSGVSLGCHLGCLPYLRERSNAEKELYIVWFYVRNKSSSFICIVSNSSVTPMAS